jgi:hypothetical protein
MTFLSRLARKRPHPLTPPGALPDLSPHMMRDIGLVPRPYAPRSSRYPLW